MTDQPMNLPDEVIAEAESSASDAWGREARALIATGGGLSAEEIVRLVVREAAPVIASYAYEQGREDARAEANPYRVVVDRADLIEVLYGASPDSPAGRKARTRLRASLDSTGEKEKGCPDEKNCRGGWICTGWDGSEPTYERCPACPDDAALAGEKEPPMWTRDYDPIRTGKERTDG